MPQLLVLFFMAAFALIFLLVLWQPLRRIIHIRRTPTTPLAMLPTYGSIETVGQALGATGLSPITGQPCALWQVEVQEWRRRGKTSTWRTIYKQTSTMPFAIGDGTGQATIEPTNGELVLHDTVKAQSGLFTSLSPEMVAALERIGIATRGFFGFERNLRVLERMIRPGEMIYVLGGVERGAGAPTIRSAPDAPLLITDRSESALLSHLYLQVAIFGGVASLMLCVAVFILLSLL